MLIRCSGCFELVSSDYLETHKEDECPNHQWPLYSCAWCCEELKPDGGDHRCDERQWAVHRTRRVYTAYRCQCGQIGSHDCPTDYSIERKALFLPMYH